MKKSNPVLSFLKEWSLFLFFISVIILSRLFLWSPVKVDGHSMDPTLANGEYLLVLKHQSIDRFDIVVATETDKDGTTKEIVKRVIGMPGDTIQYENDTLYINGKKTDEPYLTDYIKKFKEDKLQSTYTGDDYDDNGEFFRKLAAQAQAFTVDKDGSPVFTIKLLDDEYLLVLKHQSIDRFDIVVATETDDNGTTKEIVKRVIGMPGDTIQYENDTLYINGKKTDEPYLTDYIKKFKEDKLQSTYTGDDYDDNGVFFRKLAAQAQAFTVDSEGSPVFTIKLLDDEYLLLGDDRIVSKDSRQVGTFKAEQIQGEAKFRFWPLLPFKTY